MSHLLRALRLRGGSEFFNSALGSSYKVQGIGFRVSLLEAYIHIYIYVYVYIYIYVHSDLYGVFVVNTRNATHPEETK